MKKTLINLAICTSLIAGTVSAQASDEEPTPDKVTDDSAQYVGLGIGATTGAILAGPVGLVIGGFVGTLAGRNSDRPEETETAIAATTVSGESETQTAAAEPVDFAAMDMPADPLVVASTASPESVLTDEAPDHSAMLRKILTTDLSLDVYFRSGSTSVENFYAPRLYAVAALMQEMPLLELHLDGYSDRRGNRDDNLALSNQRLDAVRAQLVQAGIEDSRIHSRAHGEGRFVSRAGDLEAYTFDRRVVIRFEQAMPATAEPVASIADIPTM